MQKRLTQLTSQPNLTPEENKELDQIQNKLDNVNKNQNSGSDELSKIQNRLIELSKKPKDSLTDEEKKEILDMRNQLINLDKNKVIQNNEAPSPNNEEIVKMKQQHMDNMLDEIKKKSF